MKDKQTDWGFDVRGMDVSVRPQDDFFQYANGGWLAANEIPDDQTAWGTFYILKTENLQKSHAILEELCNKNDVAPGSIEQQLRDFYTTGMDIVGRSNDGLMPVAHLFGRVEALSDVSDVTSVAAALHLAGANVLWMPDVDQDPKNNKQMMLQIFQGGLGLPDREYYFADDKEEYRTQYRAYLAKVFAFLGGDAATVSSSVAAVMKIETELAEVSWEGERLRDIEAQCNYFTLQGLADLCPAIDWQVYFTACGVEDTAYPILVGQPGFLRKLQELFTEMPLKAWKAYFCARLATALAPALSEEWMQEHFAFYGRVLTGQKKPKPVWERCTIIIDRLMGEALGKLFVDRHFPQDAKLKIHNLVDHVVAACEERLRGLAWMSLDTRQRAVEKLRQITWKLGYPDVWRDYSALDIRADSYAQNILRAREFETRRRFRQVGKPVDRSEWYMSPATVNAYANFGRMEMVFPAGILQPPFFDPAADDAINYGAIGSTIAHELFHHFDDQGSKFNSEGNLESWWTADDREAFEKRCVILIEQFNRYTLLGRNMNGELTLGENIADLCGLEIAFAAYQDTLTEKSRRAKGGFTPEQRFFFGYAQPERAKRRDELILQCLVVDPHSPPQFRVNGPLSNMESFYEAFGVREGDGMYRPSNERAKIW